MVLIYVINGEIFIVIGKMVIFVNDGSIIVKENIGFMVEGIKNYSMIW